MDPERVKPDLITESDMHEFGVLIGRFQPFHLAHLELVRFALKQANTLCLIIGSSNQAQDIKDPWSEAQRQEMIESCLTPEERARVRFIYAEDYLYNNLMWVTAVQKDVDEVTGGSRDVKLIGFKKDASSFYLEMFPQWCDSTGNPIEPSTINLPIDATKIRELYFEKDTLSIKGLVPPTVHSFLVEFLKTEEYQRLYDENRKVFNDKEAWSRSPYQPIFHTTDAVVICSGHVLVVRRRGAYGKGLIALPGGYLEPRLLQIDNCIKELKEETSIKLPASFLKSRVVDHDTFDHPRRDLRGRVITEAFCIKLDDGELPKVKGSDDADKAWWMSLNQVDVNKRRFFADHAHIIKRFVSRY